MFTSNFKVLICGFCAFEAAIGAYWPLVMKLRSDHLGEAQRAAVTSLFRVPLNLVVCLVLLRAGWLSLAQEFSLCVGFLIVALTCQRLVVRHRVTSCPVLPFLMELSVQWRVCYFQAQALNMPLSPSASQRRAAASGRNGSSPMELLMMKVPSDDADVRSGDIFARTTADDEHLQGDSG